MAALGEPVNERPWNDDAWAAPQRGLPPTERQLEVFFAVLRLTTYERAAADLGVGRPSVHRHVVNLYARIGAHNQPHAAALLYRTYHDRMILPGEDRRRGERRAAAP